MANQERLNQIIQLVDERGFISVSELSEMLHVSEMTIRRDLEQLDVQGRLQRTYGGAASLRAKAGCEWKRQRRLPRSNSGQCLCWNVSMS